MLRDATIVDADSVAMLVLHELERRQLRRLRRLSKEQLSQLLFVGYHQPAFRYGYPAAVESTLDNQWTALFERLQVAPPQQAVVTPRARPDEWYLDMLTVRGRYRGKTYQGWWFAEWLMGDAIHRAKLSGANAMGMDVRPGSSLAKLAAQYGFVAVERRKLDRQTYFHLRLNLRGNKW